MIAKFSPNSLFLAQAFLAAFQLILYIFSSSGLVNFWLVNFSAFSVIASGLLSWGIRAKILGNAGNFSIVLFFVTMSWVISFQVPLEVVYGNVELLDPRFRLIYDASGLNALVSFSALMLDFFLLGVSLSCIRARYHPSALGREHVPTAPILIGVFIVFAVFLVTINPSYVAGGHGKVKFDGLSASFYGVLVKLSAVYLALVCFNMKEKKVNVWSWVKVVNPLFIVLVVICVSLFFLAHNRVYAVMVAVPLLFSYFLITGTRVRVISVISLFFVLSVFATLFKIYGISNIFSQGLSISDGYIVSMFYFPFTAELAGSIYSSSILYSMWDSDGLFLYGVSFLVGFLRSIPGLVGVLDIEPSLYDSAVIATLQSGASYGVGTTAIIDMLVNFGVSLSVFWFLVIGYFFGRVEFRLYLGGATPLWYVCYFSIIVLVLFYPRASFNDLIGIVVFNLSFSLIYLSLFKRGGR